MPATRTLTSQTTVASSPSGYEDSELRQAGPKRLRTRTGCWNCRHKRKKCDEHHPTCGNCSRRKVTCEWGLRLVFRPENIETLPASHPSLHQSEHGCKTPSKSVQIIDITSEIVRDYWNEIDTSSTTPGSVGTPKVPAKRPLTLEQTPTQGSRTPPRSPAQTHDETVFDDKHQPHRLSPTRQPATEQDHSDPLTTHHGPLATSMSLRSPEVGITSPRSLELMQSAAAHLLDLGSSSTVVLPGPLTEQGTGAGPPDIVQLGLPNNGERSTGASPASDGIFLPGSAYLEFHSALRNHTFQAARSTFPSRSGTPERPPTRNGPVRFIEEDNSSLLDPTFDSIESESVAAPAVPTPPNSAQLTQQQEYELWKNWVDEVAPWLDKFDHHRQFGLALPPLAREHPHLRFSILALSARQLERKYPQRSALSLALYQEAIHHLVPELQTRTTTVVASCVVLCVLEMMSCSPKMWRRHLDGCASLILSMGIHGLSGGLEQALFWCFARMDLCGAFISDEQTIIPMASWLLKPTVEENGHLVYRALGFGMYANYMVYLCGRVMDLLATTDPNDSEFSHRWKALFDHLNAWYQGRPPQMQPILNLSPAETDFRRPFPILLFSSPAAISGNQLYHTGALLMLQQKPRGVRLNTNSKVRSILWHARRISAISISNTDHACWTNCVQPLWFAGKVMSHPAEHRAILEAYDLIERETGWGARWRANDLKEYWGDLCGG